MDEKRKRTTYVVVMDWMYDNFGFNCAQANALAIVYGFSQDGESWFKGGSLYIASRLHISQKSAKNYLDNFVEKGILEMKKEMIGKVPHNIYRTVPNIENLTLLEPSDPGKNFPSEKISPVKNLPSDPGKNFHQGREKFSGEKYIEKSIENTTPSCARGAQGGGPTPKDVFTEYAKEEKPLLDALTKFDAYRATRRGKVWDAQAARAVCDKLTRLADESKTTHRTEYMIASIMQSIEAGWSVLDYPKSWGGAPKLRKTVDRTEPSGNNFLQNAAHRRPLNRKSGRCG